MLNIDCFLCLMQVDYIIIGQGLCGTWLSYYLQKENKSFLVIDNNRPDTPSRIAAGIINPVTGRRIVKTWMIDELIPFIQKAYTDLGNELRISAISQNNIIDFFPTSQMRNAFMERRKEEQTYLHEEKDTGEFRNFFNYDFGYGIISPAFITHIETILPQWRKLLLQNNQLKEEEFDFTQLRIEREKINYKEIVAKKIIFCDGVAGSENPFFKQLPSAFNKGEVLLIEVNELPSTHIYKKGLVLAPFRDTGIFWVGTNYLWEYRDHLPTKEFRIKTEKFLTDWLKVPFKTVDHKAAVRPATIERRPIVGIHPLYPNVGLLNGMGAKGCSLAPFFAKQLADHLLFKKDMLPGADVKRYCKILNGNNYPAAL